MISKFCFYMQSTLWSDLKKYYLGIFKLPHLREVDLTANRRAIQIVAKETILSQKDIAFPPLKVGVLQGIVNMNW